MSAKLYYDTPAQQFRAFAPYRNEFVIHTGSDGCVNFGIMEGGDHRKFVAIYSNPVRPEKGILVHNIGFSN